MSSPAPSLTPAPPVHPTGALPPRRAERDLDEAIVGGVAAGLARHLGLGVVWVRLFFAVAAVLSGFGIALYAAYWIFLPAASPFEQAAPGLESARRGGRRPGRRQRLTDIGPLVLLAVFGVATVLSLEALFGRSAIVWPVAIAVAGVALLWRQADESQRERWVDTSGRVDPLRIVVGRGGWAAYARVVAGIGLLLTAIIVIGFDEGSLASARTALWAGLLGILGIAIVVGPWVVRLVRELGAEREERVRTQERADVAAHLHDSVLQTLALIQKNSTDAAAVARLARAQERDLRAWLYSGDTADETTVASALRAAAAEVEDAHGISVDVVAVGDCDLDEPLRPVVAAAREALTNAAKHAGVPRVDVYAEVTDDVVEVFVRDRGTGFDAARVPEDRHGVRHSIVDRMRRHGGSADVRTSPGEGTEVRLRLPRPDPQEDP